MQDGCPETASHARLLERPVHRKEVRHRFPHAFGHMRGGGLARVNAGNVHTPQITRCCAVADPVGQDFANPGRTHDADRVHPGCDKQAIDFRRLADQRPGVGSEALRPVHEPLDTHLGKLWNECECSFHEGAELVPVLGEFKERAVSLRSVGIPHLGLGLETADDQPPRIALHIDAGIKIADHRKGIGQPRRSVP